MTLWSQGNKNHQELLLPLLPPVCNLLVDLVTVVNKAGEPMGSEIVLAEQSSCEDSVELGQQDCDRLPVAMSSL